MSRLLLCVLGLPLAACVESSSTTTAPDFNSTAAGIADDAVIPAAAAFDASAGELTASITSLCQAPDTARVEAARASWLAASADWNRFALYEFGPMTEGITPASAFIDSLKAFGQGESHVATIREDLVSIVAGETDLSTTDFGSWTYQRVGLVAIEVALFETADDPPSKDASDLVDELVASPQKCTYLIGQSDLLAIRASDLHQAWLPEGGDYRAEFLTTWEEALSNVLTSVHGHLEYLDKRGIATKGAPVSGASYDNIRASLDEVESLLSAGGGDSLRSRLEQARATDVIADHASELSAARAALDAEDPDALGTELIGLANLHKTSIPDALNIKLGLNFNDGD